MAKKEHLEEPEYDSDDMSAGARLMRYNVSNEPRPDRSILEQVDTIQPRRTASTPQVRYTQSQANLVQAARRTSARPAGDVEDDEFVTANGSLNSDRFPEDDTIFQRKPSELRGDLLYDLAGRHSRRDILSKIAAFHPQAKFGSRDLTWRLANALKSRARKQGVPGQVVKQALDDNRKTNGIAFVRGHHKVDMTAENARPMASFVETAITFEEKSCFSSLAATLVSSQFTHQS